MASDLHFGEHSLIVIGAMKSGTTSLFRYLGMHPEIGLARRKELDFFVGERNYGRGELWYSQQFPADTRWRCEASPNYTKFPLFQGVPERMRAHVPRAHLLYVVRDPVDRLRSHYRHNVLRGRETARLADVVADPDKHYAATSCYAEQLAPFSGSWRGDHIHLIDAVSLRTEPVSTVNEVLASIGIAPLPARESPWRFNQTRHKLWRVWGRKRRLFSSADRFLAGDDPARRQLRERLQRDAEQLAVRTDFDTSAWKS